jgi:multidrug efflux pump subunit AcrA (membrane-fusion protein)
MNLKHLVPTNPRKRQLLVSAAIIGVAILTSASIFATGPHANPAAHVEKAWPVSVTTAVKEDLNPSFAAFGRLESNRVAHLRSDLIARVTQVHVKEGDWVNLGDVLVQLDDREAKLQVLQRKAELLQERANLASKRSQLDLERQSAEHFESRFNVAQAKLRRHRDLWQTRLISRALLDEVVSQANEASIEYRRHEQVLTNLPNDIAAPTAVRGSVRGRSGTTARRRRTPRSAGSFPRHR